MYIDPVLFTSGDVNTSVNIATLSENTIIYLFPMSELIPKCLSTEIQLPQKVLHLCPTYNFFSYLTLLHSMDRANETKKPFKCNKILILLEYQRFDWLMASYKPKTNVKTLLKIT